MERWKRRIEKEKKKSRERLGKQQEGGGQKKKNRRYLLHVLGRGVNIKALIMVSYSTHTSKHSPESGSTTSTAKLNLTSSCNISHQLVNSAFLWAEIIWAQQIQSRHHQNCITYLKINSCLSFAMTQTVIKEKYVSLKNQRLTGSINNTIYLQIDEKLCS